MATADKRITIVITGDAEINRALKRLAGPDAKKLIRRASRKALKPVAKKAVALAPRLTGNLADNIKVKAMKRSRSRIGSRVTSGGTTRTGIQTDYTGKAYYGAFQEFGTQYQPGKQFMRRAADSEAETAMRIYRDTLSKGIDTLVK